MLRESDIEKLSQDSGKIWGGRTRKVRRLWYPGNTGSKYFRGISLEDSALTSWPQLLMKTQPVASSFRTLPGRFHMETLHLRIACQRQDGKQSKGVMCWYPSSLLFSIGRSPHHGHYFWVVSSAHRGSPRFHGSRQSWDSCASDHDGPDGGYGQNQSPPGERWELDCVTLRLFWTITRVFLARKQSKWCSAPCGDGIHLKWVCPHCEGVGSILPHCCDFLSSTKTKPSLMFHTQSI